MNDVPLAQKVTENMLNQQPTTFTQHVVADFSCDRAGPGAKVKTLQSIVADVLEAVVAEGYHFVKTRETGSFNREVKSV